MEKNYNDIYVNDTPCISSRVYVKPLSYFLVIGIILLAGCGSNADSTPPQVPEIANALPEESVGEVDEPINNVIVDESSSVPGSTNDISLVNEITTLPVSEPVPPTPAPVLPRPSDFLLDMQPVYLVTDEAPLALTIELRVPENSSSKVRIVADVSEEFKLLQTGVISFLSDVPQGDEELAQESVAGSAMEVGVEEVVCQASDSLVCEFSVNSSVSSVQLPISLLSEEKGDGKLNIEVFLDSSNGDNTQPYLDSEITLKQVLPVSILTDLVLNAPLASTVELPPGVYGGSFALPLLQRDEWKVMKGATGDEPTVLVGGITKPLFEDLPLGFTVSNMVLQSYGEPIVGAHRSMVTFDNNIIEPADYEQPHSLNSALITNYNGESIRLSNNLIRNWGNSENSFCGNLIVADKAEVLIRIDVSFGELQVQHNVFENNQCKSLMKAQFMSDLTIENNTFVDNDNALIDIERLPRRITFFNNIVTGGNPSILYRLESDTESNAPSLQEETDMANFGIDEVWFTLASNILWNTGNTDIVNEHLRSLEGFNELQRAQYIDPLFMDIDDGDYRLSSLSPAIDAAGILPTRFKLVTVYGGCFRTSCDILDRFTGHRWRISAKAPPYWTEPPYRSYLSFSFQPTRQESLPQPLAGNGDTNEFSGYDIGAKEYVHQSP